jgi:creatinine amidohydrolase
MRNATRLVLLATLASAALPAQVRKLHTRDLTRLSEVQVADHLKRSDVVFIPVGAVETNGIMPSDRDYVTPLAYAMTMAEQTDSLYMPGLIWSFPGTTSVAHSTIYLSPADGTAHLKLIAKSLLRQGFRRQIYLSSGQGPAPITVGTLVREFFEETHVPILYIDMDTYVPRLNLPAESRNRILYGAHQIANRIEDLPLRGDYGEKESQAATPIPVNEGLAALGKLGFSGSLTLGSYIPDVMAHGARPVLPSTAAEREAWAKEGAQQLRAIVAKMQLPEALSALQKHDRFTQEVIVPKFGKTLPH